MSSVGEGGRTVLSARVTVVLTATASTMDTVITRSCSFQHRVLRVDQHPDRRCRSRQRVLGVLRKHRAGGVVTHSAVGRPLGAPVAHPDVHPRWRTTPGASTRVDSDRVNSLTLSRTPTHHYPSSIKPRAAQAPRTRSPARPCPSPPSPAAAGLPPPLSRDRRLLKQDERDEEVLQQKKITNCFDDCGFGASSAFGGPCSTPVAERLAASGLKYNRFHTTALCSPTRAALLSGRNHHAVGMGGVTEIATSAPGYSSVRPNTAAPLAETLKLNGYSTAQFGKCHEVPVWQTSSMGPFDAWPSGGGGFEHSTGSWVGRPTSTRRRSTRTGCRWSPTGPPRRATISPRT